MEVTAPHLTHPMPMLIPLTSSVTAAQAAHHPGRPDRRRPAPAQRRTPGRDPAPARAGSPPPRRSRWRPALRRAGLRGGAPLLGRPARGRRPAGHRPSPARPPRTAPTSAPAPGSCPRPAPGSSSATSSPARRTPSTPAPSSTPTGVWAGDLVDEVTPAPEPRHPPRAARADAIPGLQVAVSAPVPGDDQPLRDGAPPARRHALRRPHRRAGRRRDPRRARAVRARDRLPARRGLRGVRPAAAPLATWSARTPACGRCSTVARRRRRRDRRPLPPARRAHLARPAWSPSSAASSRRTAGWPRTPSTPPSPAPGSTADPCRTRDLPLLGAAPARELAALEQPARLVRRYGTDAALVLENARAVSGLTDDELLAPIADGVPVTLAELLFGVTHEGAADVDDLLDRRTRVGLVPADRELAVPAAERALQIVANGPTEHGKPALPTGSSPWEETISLVNQ